jgi:hypothetical protein
VPGRMINRNATGEPGEGEHDESECLELITDHVDIPYNYTGTDEKPKENYRGYWLPDYRGYGKGDTCCALPGRLKCARPLSYALKEGPVGGSSNQCTIPGERSFECIERDLLHDHTQCRFREPGVQFTPNWEPKWYRDQECCGVLWYCKGHIDWVRNPTLKLKVS